jgi:hypothetical protein
MQPRSWGLLLASGIEIVACGAVMGRDRAVDGGEAGVATADAGGGVAANAEASVACAWTAIQHAEPGGSSSGGCQRDSCGTIGHRCSAGNGCVEGCCAGGSTCVAAGAACGQGVCEVDAGPPSTLHYTATCGGCGGEGQPCCAGSWCAAPLTACGADRVCHQCGGFGGPCCSGSCIFGLFCRQDYTCIDCVGEGCSGWAADGSFLYGCPNPADGCENCYRGPLGWR